MTIQAPVESNIPSEELETYKSKFCSRIQAGVGHHSFSDSKRKIRPRLAPFDAGYGDARAKVDIEPGDRIEISTGLVMPRSLVENTLLGALVFRWEDVEADNQQALRQLREEGKLKLQYQGPDSKWRRIDRFTNMADVTILPAAGNIVAVRRVGSDSESNCRLVIHKDFSGMDSVGVTLELIATKRINALELLALDVPAAGTANELAQLKAELDLLGQPYYSGAFDSLRSDNDGTFSNESGEMVCSK